MTTDPTTHSDPEHGEHTPDVRLISVEIDYRHSHHVPRDVEYPSEESLKSKIEENLVRPGLWRVYVCTKNPKEVTVNAVTMKGIELPTHMAGNIDAEELERILLSICYRHMKDVTKERTKYLVRFMFRLPPGMRAKKVEVTFSLEPFDDSGDYDDRDRGRDADDRPLPDDRDLQREHHEERFSRGPWRDPPRDSFVEQNSPYSDTSRNRRRESWRDNLMRDLPERPAARVMDVDPRHDAAVALRRKQLFSPDMMMQFDPGRLAPQDQRAYTDNVLQYAMINNSMQLSHQNIAAAFDMVTSAALVQSRMHAMQMSVAMDERQQLMKLPLKFLEIEANNKDHQAQILRESQQNYIEALRMRGEMSGRELGYERQNMMSQFQLAEVQRVAAEQELKFKQTQTDSFRGDLLRGLGPMLLGGLGMFLEFFGQKKLGAQVKMTGTMVDGLMQNIDKQRAAAKQAAQSAPPTPQTQHPQHPQAPVVDVSGIPRRHIRLGDVATEAEIQMQPMRSLCRMVDVAFSDEDRLRVQQMLSAEEWQRLEGALRAPSDQECTAGLAIFMLGVGQDEVRKQQFVDLLTPAQKELLDKIGDLINGEEVNLSPDYAVSLRPRRTVMRPQPVTVEGEDPIPVPPPDLDEVELPPPDDLPVPDVESPLDLPEPDLPAADLPMPDPGDSSGSVNQQILEQLQCMRADVAEVRAENDRLRDEIKRAKTLSKVDGSALLEKPVKAARARKKPARRARRHDSSV